MKFIRTDDLRPGMRLAKPIYNKIGVMLYERNSKLTMQGIVAIQNFGFLGIYILEPAEPVPPMTEEDVEFERFQTIGVFSLKEDMDLIRKDKKPNSLIKTANSILKSYGNLDHKINFIQNLRSREDMVYKHTLNVAILCALISKTARSPYKEQEDLVIAALVHDIGMLMMTPAQRMKEEAKKSRDGVHIDEETTAGGEELDLTAGYRKMGYDRVLKNFNLSRDAQSILTQYYLPDFDAKDPKLLRASKILKIANAFDQLTAMKFEEPPASEIEAIRRLKEEREFDNTLVDALIKSINILTPGVCVELTNGKKGLVLTENETDVLRPMVLSFEQNHIYNLNMDDVYREVQIKDIMKTMDNRFVMDKDMLSELSSKPVTLPRGANWNKSEDAEKNS